MRCPFCDHPDTKVIDARNQRDTPVKRRRRECSECQRRFTTYERIEDLLPMVVKTDGRRELFDRLKIITGMQKACQKRPVSADAIEQAARDGVIDLDDLDALDALDFAGFLARRVDLGRAGAGSRQPGHVLGRTGGQQHGGGRDHAQTPSAGGHPAQS